MQISKATPSDAALVAVALSKENYSCQCVEQEGIFSISVLSQDTPATVIGAQMCIRDRAHTPPAHFPLDSRPPPLL